MERSQTETIAREKGYKVERDGHSGANSYFSEVMVRELETEYPGYKYVGYYRFVHNGKSREEADYDTKSQNEGKDGYFILQNIDTGELIKVYFQEKFSTTPLYKTDKYCYESFEIVDNFKYRGWGCHLTDVKYLIFFHPDRIVMMKNIDGLIGACNEMYDEWKKTSKYEPQTLTVPSLGNQKIYIGKNDDPTDPNKWKVTTPMSDWAWRKLGVKYRVEKFGLDKYKE